MSEIESMNTNINLLLPKDEESLKRRKSIKVVSLIAVFFLVGTGIISLTLFLMIQAVNLSSIRKAQADVLREISTFQDRQNKILAVNNRIENVQQIINTRKDLLRITNTILAKTPAGVSIEDIEVDNKFIILTAVSPSLLSIDQFINNLTDMVRNKEMISSLTLSGLVFEEGENFYQVSIKSEI